MKWCISGNGMFIGGNTLTNMAETRIITVAGMVLAFLLGAINLLIMD
jgi:hypothetical protein